MSCAIPKNVIPLLAFCLSLLAAVSFNQLRSPAPPELGDTQVAQASALYSGGYAPGSEELQLEDCSVLVPIPPLSLYGCCSYSMYLATG